MAFSKKNKSKRTKKFIDRGVQGALVRRLAFHWIAFLVVGTGVSLMFQYLTDPFTALDKHFEYFFQHQAGFVAVMVCMTPVFLYDTVKLSNRFAGPILRLRRALKEMANGEKVERLSFRPGDFWIEIADDFNAVLDHQQATASSPPDADSVQDEPELVGAAN